MALQPAVTLSSSNIGSCAYDPDAQQLQVTFTSGATYEYDDVPPAVYAGLLVAPSPGKYFAGVIKGAYRYRQL